MSNINYACSHLNALADADMVDHSFCCSGQHRNETLWCSASLIPILCFGVDLD